MGCFVRNSEWFIGEFNLSLPAVIYQTKNKFVFLICDKIVIVWNKSEKYVVLSAKVKS